MTFTRVNYVQLKNNNFSLQHFTISGQEGSPVFHLYLKQNLPREQKENALESIAEQVKFYVKKG